MRDRRIGLRLVAFLLLLAPLSSLAASFDCSKAERELDRTICADEELSALDESMAEYYFALRESLDQPAADELLDAQREWLKQRSRSCNADDTSCLVELYREQIFALRKEHEHLVPYTFIDPQVLQGVRHRCAFTEKLPDDMLIYAGGGYSGRKIDRQIDQSGHQAGRFEVIVNSPDRPVALLLGAYDPTIWNIAWTEHTRIAAVMATGYYRQAVAGVPDDTPILVSTHANRGPCGYLYIAEKNLGEVNPFSSRVFGRAVDMVHYANGGTLVLGERIAADDKLYTSTDRAPESFIDESMPLAGEAGIQQLLSEGALRQATMGDLQRWQQMQKAASGEKLPPVANPPGADATRAGQLLHKGYVILEKIRIPAGLYGGHSVTFFLPQGVPYPDGKLGHSQMYDFNSLLCGGPRCGY